MILVGDVSCGDKVENLMSIDKILDVLKLAIIDSSKKIHDAIINSLIHEEGIKNATNDRVLNIDLVVNSIFLSHLDSSGLCNEILSEECLYRICSNNESLYNVVLDPLDGSTNTSCNLPTGTIFGIVEKRTGVLLAAGYALYGQTTLLVVAKESRVQLFSLKDVSSGFGPFQKIRKKFVVLNNNVRCPNEGNIYSTNESYSHLWLTEEPKNYINSIKSKNFKSRYFGCMVADCHQILMKGGIFFYPENENSRRGKLRLMYEAKPMAFIFKIAGGFAFNSSFEELDQIHSGNDHARISVVIGSRSNVNQYFSLFTKQ